MKITAVGFDYGGVLNGATGSQFTQQACALLEVSQKDFLAAYFRHNTKVNRDEVDWPELWRLVLADLGKTDRLADLLAIRDNRGQDALNESVLQLAHELKAKGYKLGILSNNQAVALEHMKHQSLDALFPVIHVSALTGLVKPEPQAFLHFAKALSVPVTELLFIDDSAHSLSTAKTVGYTPLQFESAEQLRRELTQLGLL